MADNIKIVGEILETQQISRYSDEDLNLLLPELLKEDFGQQNDYIEYFVYDAGNNLLNINYLYKDFKLPTISYIDPVNGSLPIIEIDPVKDLQNLEYSSGEFIVQYNFFNNKVSDAQETGLFIKEISADRTELRLGSTVLTNEQIEDVTLNIINEYTGSSYFVDYLANFGNNQQTIIVNVALNKIESGYEIFLKLYQPLDIAIQEKATLWIVKEKINPYSFNINLDRLIIPTPGPQLRGPNFNIPIPNQNNVSTAYQNYNNLITNTSASYQQLLSLITSQSIDINIDYSNFANFSFFGSAEQRVLNFYNKVKEIEDYKTNIAAYTALTSSRPNLKNDLNLATASINNIIANFDGFEYYLYFESGSLTSSVDYGVTPYPKSGSNLPYILYSTGSTSASVWLSYTTGSAAEWNEYNQNYIVNTLPTFLKDDTNNDPYITFLNMVGHYFDNIWIFLQSVTDINLANNNLEQGVSKDLVYYVLQSLGVKLYNKYGDSNDFKFLIGNNTGSSTFDNNFTSTGSYLNNIPRKDLLAESYKRIYHNLPLLLKTKGTAYGLQTLISTFGIPNLPYSTSYDANGSASYYYVTSNTGSGITSSILNVKEYGGDLKGSMLDEYNNDKIRIVSSSIVTGSVLSPYISVQTISSSLFRTNDLHYIDISFSPETQIDIYASASIAAANPTWKLDDYIGDPGYLYSSSYSDLNTQKNTYYNFTASYMDYAGFIRLIQFFDNALFKMLKDFVPARANLSTGVTISSPVLERNKWSYANLSNTSKVDSKDGIIEGPTIESEYTDLYTGLSGDKAAYYDGNITGSNINVYSYFENGNVNPYLYNFTNWNNGHPSESIDLYKFSFSNFNILFNNVSQSRESLTRKKIEPIYVMNSPLSLAGYSSSYNAELQDSYLSLKSHQLSRYEGTKLTSLKYNTYTSESYTGSNGITIQNGDISFGKTAVVDKNTNKVGLFTEIKENIYLPKRNNVVLKYLVDGEGGLTELNERNKNWHELQRTFIAGDTLDVSLFNVQNNQKTTNGTKPIFDSGYAYYPILYFSSCDKDPKIYFESADELKAYPLQAINGLSPKTVNGYNTNNYPVVGTPPNGNVYNIFDTILEGSTYYTTGSISNQLFPSYSVQESGNHKANGNFILDLYMPLGGQSVWSFSIYKNNTELFKQTANLNLATTFNPVEQSPYYTRYPCRETTSDLNINGILLGTLTFAIAGTNFNIGDNIYSYNLYKVKTGCNVSDYTTLYSKASSISLYPFPECNESCGTGFADVWGGTTGESSYILYDIPNFTLDPSGRVFYGFNIDLPNISGVTKDDFIIPKLILESTSTTNYTASITEGSFTVSSLATQIGYANASCLYFSSSSISASVAANDRNTITFSNELSNFHNKNYIFIPNPIYTGSLGILASNSLYPIYKEVDYSFAIKPFDIILTYLSDGTYVESRVLKVNTSSSLLQVTLDTSMSTTQISNFQSGSYQRFLILSRKEDETNAYVTFKKRDGSTSYGFVIPSNISSDFLNNIDTITREVKQRLINEQLL
jgi:hypothetical protein